MKDFTIDRCDPERRKGEALNAALDAHDSLFLCVSKGRPLLADSQPVLLGQERVTDLVDRVETVVFLGRMRGRACFALDVSGLEKSGPFETGSCVDLRLGGSSMAADGLGVCFYARSILDWHRRHRFCANCGSTSQPREGGHVRVCESCESRHFPRTDPAVMILIHDGAGRCLLARQPGFPDGMYSVLAGFVEPGENLEQTVLREAEEEVGLKVSDLRYLQSQPWPFPASLMIGYFCRALTTDIELDGEELESARWVSRDELRTPNGFFYPPAVSLAHHLIRRFIDGEA